MTEEKDEFAAVAAATVLDAAPDAFILVDASGTVRFANQQVTALFGYRRDEVIGLPIEALIPEPARARHAEHRRQYMGVGERRLMGVSLDVFALHQDGHQFPVEVSLSQIVPGPTGLVAATIRDVSEGKRLQRSPREHQQLLRRLIEFSDDAIITKTLDGTVTSWNPAAQKLFGYTAEEAIGHSMQLVIPPERSNEETMILAKIARGELVDHFETVRARANGTRIDISTTISPLKDANGRVIGASTIARDITERKTHERKMLAQLARLNLLQQVTRAIGERQDVDSIYQVVIRSIEDHMSVDFAAIALYEPASDVIVLKRVGAKSRALAVALTLSEEARVGIDQNGLSRCLRGNLVYESDLSDATHPLPAKLASAGLRALVIAPLSVTNKVFGVMILARRAPASFASSDCEFLLQLSDHVALAAHQAQLYAALQQAYEDLRRTQQTVMQQERLRALGQMASGIAHDISNSLSPAALYAQVLLERDPGLDEHTRRSLGVIQQAVEDAGRTLGRLQTFYRPREGESRPIDFDLNALLQQVADITRARWSDMPQERGIVIHLRMDLAPDLPRIMGAENEIRDALTNLVLNAVDAMPEGGTLTLRSRVSAAGDDGPLRASAEVIDTGVGMSEATRRRCFEPFFTTKGERGTGLGLAMVYGMAQRHGADCEIESNLGHGTTVRLSFPVMPALPGAPAARTRHSVPPLRILVVDDDPLILQSLRDILEFDGHVVVTADGGQSGIDEFLAAREADRAFDIVISDVGMPNVDGRTLGASIRSVEPGISIILLTGWGQRLQAEPDVSRYADRVLSKPPRMSELRTALRELAKSRR